MDNNLILCCCIHLHIYCITLCCCVFYHITNTEFENLPGKFFNCCNRSYRVYGMTTFASRIYSYNQIYIFWSIYNRCLRNHNLINHFGFIKTFNNFLKLCRINNIIQKFRKYTSVNVLTTSPTQQRCSGGRRSWWLAATAWTSPTPRPSLGWGTTENWTLLTCLIKTTS